MQRWLLSIAKRYELICSRVSLGRTASIFSIQISLIVMTIAGSVPRSGQTNERSTAAMAGGSGGKPSAAVGASIKAVKASRIVTLTK